MKIRLFKPKTSLNTEISITVEVLNSPSHFCLKGNNLHNRQSMTCGQKRSYNYCLKGRTIAAASINICAGKKQPNRMEIRYWELVTHNSHFHTLPICTVSYFGNIANICIEL
jgi:hypothetical protein